MIGEQVTVTLPDGTEYVGVLVHASADVREVPSGGLWRRVEAAGTFDLTITNARRVTPEDAR